MTSVLGVRVYSGSSFGGSHGSTDPTDVAYDPSTGSFFICDSEVDESPFFSSTNLFRLDADGDPLQSFSLRGFTSEPTGLTMWVDPDSGARRLFVCDDNQKRIFVLDPADPTVVLRSFSTTAFNAGDPEDLSINPNNGNLFVLSENDRSIYEVTQAGVLVSKVTLPSTMTTPEGLVYDAENNQFFVCGGFSSKIFVVSRTGVITGTIDVLKDYPNSGGARVIPKGLELGPSSDGSGNLSLWVTDYGKDQVADGRLIEIMLDRPAAPPPPPPPPPPEETLTGTSGNDVLNATSDANWTVDGLAGNDTITTLGGNDIIKGGAGNDTVNAGSSDDLIQFTGSSQGVDRVDGGTGNDRIEAMAKGTVIGLASVTGVEVISANGFSSVSIRGNDAANVLDFTNVVLTGISSINGGGGSDTIYGSSAADLIAGGAGADTLRGNEGADRFDFNALSDSRASARDQIQDFQPGTDKIDLVGVDAVSTVSGNQAFSFIGEDAFTNKAGQLRIDRSDSARTVVLGDVNGDGVADFAIELTGSIQLNASDFLL